MTLEELINQLIDLKCHCKEMSEITSENIWLKDVEALNQAIKNLSKIGKWIKQDDHNKVCYGWNYCSNCGAICGEEPNYCSECGAYMKTEEVDKD